MSKRIPWNKGKKLGPLSEEEKERKYASRRGRIPWNKGKKASAEAIEKNRQVHLGKKVSEETRQKLSKALKGRVVSEETRQKLSNSLKGRKSPMEGKKFSEEHKQKISKALKGNKNGEGKVCSEEKKEKISNKLKGRIIKPESIEKCKQTRLKHGLYIIPKEAKLKEFETKRKNNSFNKSAFEEKVESLLDKKFNIVSKQYYSENYPFHCDFYIKDIDTYIEIQGHWTHGYKPYEGTENDLERLKILEEKANSSKFYKTAIKVWTITDPLKRKTAKENNLNWLEFFNMEEFMSWYNQDEVR